MGFNSNMHLSEILWKASTTQSIDLNFLTANLKRKQIRALLSEAKIRGLAKLLLYLGLTQALKEKATVTQRSKMAQLMLEKPRKALLGNRHTPRSRSESGRLIKPWVFFRQKSQHFVLFIKKIISRFFFPLISIWHPYDPVFNLQEYWPKKNFIYLRIGRQDKFLWKNIWDRESRLAKRRAEQHYFMYGTMFEVMELQKRFQ